MATYNLQIGGARNHPMDCAPDDVKCYGLDRGHHMHEDGGLLDVNVCQMLNRAMVKYGKTAADLAVGDEILLPVPTWSVLESVAVHMESDSFGLRFDVLDTQGRTLTGAHWRSAYTAAAGAVPCEQEAALVAAAASPNALGALTVRDTFDFSRTAVPLFYDVPGGIKLVITALPAAPKTLADVDLRVFINVRRYAVCHGKRCVDVQSQA